MIEDPVNIRERLLAEVLRFVRSASQIPGVRSISLLGSIVTGKTDPKDVDLLVVISDDMDLEPLARCSRRLQGQAQSMNRNADVFLADTHDTYLGRTCPWKRCGPGIRASCDALNCGWRQYLHDDLETIRLSDEVVNSPPVQLWPVIERRCVPPADVEKTLRELELIAGSR